jgi:hypothetical protein
METLKANLSDLQEKAKERTVKTQSIEYDLETLVKKIEKGIINLDPDYQRRHRWNNEMSSRLIESLILNIPIPLIYLSQDFDVDAETEDSRYSVIDGQQRLTAIYNFFENAYSLQGLKTLSTLNGSYYHDLPPFLIRRLEERTIRCLRIDSTVDPQVKIDIFERLNSGSVKLEVQEIRNAVHRGTFNILCKELAEFPSFRALLQIPEKGVEHNPKVQNMEDVELVLRFFALFSGKYKNFKKIKDFSFKDFLTDELVNGNKLSKEELNKLSGEFRKTMDFIYQNFGSLAFAKYKCENKKLKLQSKFNSAVFDALAIAVHQEFIAKKKGFNETSKENFLNLFRNEDFYESVSASTADSKKLAHRIEEAIKVFR